VVTVLKISD